MAFKDRVNEHITDARTRGPGELGLNRWGSKAGELAESTFVKIGFQDSKGKPCQANCRVLRRLRLMKSQSRSTLSEA